MRKLLTFAPSNVDTMNMASLPQLLQDLLSTNVLLACLVVMLNPLLWNIAARLEYNTHTISRVCGGPRIGVAVLAAFIMGNNFLRTSFFHFMMDEATPWDALKGSSAIAVGYIIIGVGGLLVLSSAWRLGFFCTFLGDYFGILLNDRVTGFPFNVVYNPMYWGSFLIYVGDSLQHASPVGLLLTLFIGLSYVIAMRFEGPFTAIIYAEQEKSKSS